MGYRRLKPGINDLESYCKKHDLQCILDEWDYSKNDGLSPSTVTYGEHTTIDWICAKGHTFQQLINARVGQRQKCPYCTGKRVWSGDNDLLTRYPNIAKELSPENNVSASQINPGTKTSYKWICSKCGHVWQAKVYNRTKNQSGCPACAGQVVVKGKNDLASQYPQIALEWDYEKNDKTPEEYTSKSHDDVNWLCPTCGHSYHMRIQSRTALNQGCNKCAKRLQTSFPEQAIFYYVRKAFYDAVNSCKTALNGKFELDVFIPSKKIGIEYDGARWHGSSYEKDARKYELCKSEGIFLIRVSEIHYDSGIKIADKTIVSDYNQGKQLIDLVPAIQELMQYLGVQTVMDVANDEIRIKEQSVRELKKKSAGELYPELIREWYQEKNGEITLFKLSPNDKYPGYWWKCSKCGKPWQTSVGHRTRGEGCRDCGYKKAGKKLTERAIIKNGSLEEVFPEIAKEWDSEKNGGKKASEVASKTNRKYYWKCPKGHPSYPARIADRTMKNSGCPLCAPNHSRRVLCEETGVVYESIRQAKIVTGFSNIERCVRGQGKTAGGYHWKYYDE